MWNECDSDSLDEMLIDTCICDNDSSGEPSDTDTNDNSLDD